MLHRPLAPALLLLALAACDDKPGKKDDTSTSSASAAATATATATATASAAPSDGLTEMKGELYDYTLRFVEGAKVTKERKNEHLAGKTDHGAIDCYVNNSKSVYIQPKDMAQALREFTTMGYSMKPSWQDESEGRFYAQLDKVKGANVSHDTTVHASIRVDAPISMRISCYGPADDAELMRKIVKSFEPANTK